MKVTAAVLNKHDILEAIPLFWWYIKKREIWSINDLSGLAKEFCEKLFMICICVHIYVYICLLHLQCMRVCS